MVEKYSYDVFGAVTIRDASDQILTTSNFGNCRMFTGREYDTETSLYYYRARYYKPSIGRFLQTDPIGYADSMNLYQYCLNNPVNWIDPWGLVSERTPQSQQLLLDLYGKDIARELVGAAADAAAKTTVATGVATSPWWGKKVWDKLKEIFHPSDSSSGSEDDSSSGNRSEKNCPSDSAKDAADKINKGQDPGKDWSQRGGDKGGYYNKGTRESLRPDDSGHGRHVDYNRRGGGKGHRIYPDGRIEPKK